MSLGIAILVALGGGIIATVLFSLLVIKRLQEKDNRGVSNFFAAVIFIVGGVIFCLSLYIDDFIMKKVDNSIGDATDFLIEVFPDSRMFNEGYPQKDIDQFFIDLGNLKVENGGFLGATVNRFLGKIVDSTVEKKDLILSILSDGETLSFYTVTDSFRENSREVVELICLIVQLVLIGLCLIFCLVIIISVIVAERNKLKEQKQE